MAEDIFVSVDCETSGPFPGRHAILSLGAVVVTWSGARWVLGPEHYEEWAPPEEAEEDPAATAVHQLDLADLRLRGKAAGEATATFAAWVDAQGSARRVFAGYNAPFDWAFVLHAFGAARVASPFHHVPLDLKAAIWGAHGGLWKTGNNPKALERLLGHPIPTPPNLRPHHALDDARSQAEILVALLAYLEKRGPAAQQ